MGWRSFSALPLAPVILLAGSFARADTPTDLVADQLALAQIVQHPFRNNCDQPGPTGIRCFAKTRTDENGDVVHYAQPQAYGPTDIQSAYKIQPTAGAGKTVALIDFYHYASAESDLAAYRTQYGLPACTTANGCFTQVYEDGSTNFSGADPQGCNGWAGEAALDLQMVSAACPACKILLVEVDGNSQSDQDISAALATAAAKGAVAISNSYGGGEDPSMESSYTLYSKGVLVTAAAGDQGYGVSYPASSAGVVAVGGTSLATSSSARGWAETAWNSTGSGCSSEIAKPSWQTDTGCSRRMEADVSAVADPNTGVSVNCGGQWQVVGGTSAASPIVAASFTAFGVSPSPEFVWTHTADFYDVTSGSNGSCSPSYLCNAGVGYDGPTGWGTPNGDLLAGAGSGSGSGGSSGSSSGSSGSSSGSTGSGSGGSGGSSGSSSGSSGSSGSSSGVASSSGSGSSGGSSSGVSSSSGAGHDAGANGDNPTSNDLGWNPDAPPQGCGCSTVGVGENRGALVLGLGLVLGLAIRRRRAQPSTSRRR